MASPIAQAFVDVQLNQKAFLSGLAGSQAAFTKTTGAMQMRAATTSAAITKSFVAAGAGLALLGGIVASGVKSAAKYETAWREVWTLMDNTEEQMRSLADATGRMSVKFGQAETTGLKALYQITSAGYGGADAMKVLEASLTGAVAGVSDVFTAADMLTGALMAWNAPATQSAHIMDIIFNTIKQGKLTMDSLADGAGRVMAVAGPFGISMEQTFAALATLTKPLGGVHLAATALVATIRSFLKPTPEMIKLIEKWEFASGRALLEEKGLAETTLFFSTAAKEAGVGIEELFTNIRAMMGVMPLTTTMSEEYARILASYGDIAGDASAAAKKMMQSFEMQWAVFSETLGRAKRLFGEAFLPMVTAGLEKIIPYVEKLAEYFRQNGDAVRYFVMHAMKMLGIIVLVGGIAKAFKLLMNPVGALIAAAALLYGAWYFNLYGIREMAENLGETLTKVVTAPLKFALKLAGADEAAASVETFMGSLNESIVGVAAAMGGFILGGWLVKGLLGKLTGAVLTGSALTLPTLAIAAMLAWDVVNTMGAMKEGAGWPTALDLGTRVVSAILGGIAGAIAGHPVIGAAAGYAFAVGVQALLEINWDVVSKAWGTVSEAIGGTVIKMFDWSYKAPAAIEKVDSAVKDLTKSVTDLDIAISNVTGLPFVPQLNLPGMPVLGKAAGGFVPGQGLGDTIPAMLEPGEFVVPNWMMRIPWLASLISGVWSGAEHFQAGGAVGLASGVGGGVSFAAMGLEEFKNYIHDINQMDRRAKTLLSSPRW